MANQFEIFGENVFTDRLMQERLPKDTYRFLRQTIDEGMPLNERVADVVANAMKDWALEKGATHYTHWFQPLTDSTAEKYDSFLSPIGDGSIILEFSGKQLIQGEPDASSFPNGGLRATFEARGYTAWDCTSPAFLKEDSAGNKTLCIPTVFYSYRGEALDKKTPLLRSCSALSKHVVRVLRALGNTTATNAKATVGPEQEYFLIDKVYYEQRLDLVACGRTLFGAPPAKGQEMGDQYFGSVKDRISLFMRELDRALWKMGITAKTEHNEVAPSQYEVVPVFETVNIASDDNQLVMETLKKLARKHNFVCLLHEKPFAGVNGSGKHNNFSICTNDGINLFDPGNTPQDNLIFLITIVALVKSIDEHAELLRATAATASNDHRLGANEAPPAIISIFLGDPLKEMLEQIEKGGTISYSGKTNIKIGVDTLPNLPKDNTDRNRTSPFAFTGNKFEFRMLGSSSSIAGTNVVLTSILAQAFDEIALRLEKASNVKEEAIHIVKEYYGMHKRVVFNGNNYAQEWTVEAQKRGLPNIKTTVDALKAYISERSIGLFSKYGVFSAQELYSRYDIYMKRYSQTINIEGRVAVEMVKTQYFPAIAEYLNVLADGILKLKEVGISFKVQEALAKEISRYFEVGYDKLHMLEEALKLAQKEDDLTKQAFLYRNQVLKGIEEIRSPIDQLEALLPKDKWPVPRYTQMLFLSMM